MKKQKNILLIFPYQTQTGDLHPWIKNEVIVFKKLGYKVDFLFLPSIKNTLVAAILTLVKLLTAPFLILNNQAVLVPTSYLMFYPIIISKIFGKKIFISHLSTTADPSENFSVLWIIRKTLNFSDRVSFRFADYILTFSETIAKKIADVNSINFDTNKFYCSEVIDSKIFKPIPEIGKKLRKELNLEGKGVLFYHGKFHSWHGMEYFFEAFKVLYKRNKNFRLIVLSFPKSLQKRYLDDSVIKHPGIIFLSPVKYERLAYMLQVADLWVGRFKYNKYGDTAFSTCGVEAMACGKPIITYDIFENSRVISDEVNGLLVPGNNSQAIVDKIYPYFKKENYFKLQQMGKNARKTAIKEFSNQNLLNWLRKLD